MSKSKYLNEIFNNIEVDAKVIDVYDGDTVTVEFPFPNVTTKDKNKDLIIKFKVRMSGYDTAEKRTRDRNEKRIALLCQKALSNRVLNKTIKLKCESLDKYGRLLGIIYCDNENINEYMLSSNFGYSYGGGKKANIKYNEDNSYEINGNKYIIPNIE